LPHRAAYGGDVGYDLGTFIINDKVMDALLPGGAAITAIIDLVTQDAIDLDSGLWSGLPEDRTSTSNVGFLLIIIWAQSIAEIVSETISDAIPDDIEIPLICQDLPNPLKITAEWGPEFAIKLAGFALDQIKRAADFQDGLVDGAEVEAAYEHSRNLLEKSCAVYDASVCRCQVGDDDDPAGTYGQGCDGLDSDCDDVIDECDEDTVLPTIYVEEAFDACAAGTGRWFADTAEAQQCVEETILVTDDCQVRRCLELENPLELKRWFESTKLTLCVRFLPRRQPRAS
jgi:hypothetical protein